MKSVSARRTNGSGRCAKSVFPLTDKDIARATEFAAETYTFAAETASLKVNCFTCDCFTFLVLLFVSSECGVAGVDIITGYQSQCCVLALACSRVRNCYRQLQSTQNSSGKHAYGCVAQPPINVTFGASQYDASGSPNSASRVALEILNFTILILHYITRCITALTALSDYVGDHEIIKS